MARGPTPRPVQTPPIGRVRRGDVGIGAVIDVEQRALRAFEEDRLAGAHRLGQHQRDIADPRPQALAVRPAADRAPRCQSMVESWTRRLRAVTLSRTFCSSPLGSVRSHDADAAARDLVLVGRTDAARGRPDLPLAPPRLGQQVEIAVIRQDQVRLVADDEAAGRRRCRSSSARRPRRTAPADRRRRRCR